MKTFLNYARFLKSHKRYPLNNLRKTLKRMLAYKAHMQGFIPMDVPAEMAYDRSI